MKSHIVLPAGAVCGNDSLTCLIGADHCKTCQGIAVKLLKDCRGALYVEWLGLLGEKDHPRYKRLKKLMDRIDAMLGDDVEISPLGEEPKP